MIGFHIDMRFHEAWLISIYEPFGNIVLYLQQYQPDMATRLELVGVDHCNLVGRRCLRLFKGHGYGGRPRVPPRTHICYLSRRSERRMSNPLLIARCLIISLQANVLVNRNRRAVLCDFGLAKVMQEEPSGLTTSTVSMGTLRYLSPELLNEEDAPRNLKSDIWAWACVLNEVRFHIS